MYVRRCIAEVSRPKSRGGDAREISGPSPLTRYLERNDQFYWLSSLPELARFYCSNNPNISFEGIIPFPGFDGALSHLVLS
jgi:hypothetical protein